MTLLISILAASVVLRFEVPGPGSYSLFSTTDYSMAIVEASGHVDRACHVAATLPKDKSTSIFWVWFHPDKPQ